jgi:hypothetical protein
VTCVLFWLSTDVLATAGELRERLQWPVDRFAAVMGQTAATPKEELMHGLIATLFIAALQAAPSPSQQPSAPSPLQPKASVPADSSLSTLAGCVSAKPDVTGTYTFTQKDNGSRFKLTGKSMREWAGKPVEIVSAKEKGLSIRGGLVPSTNVAAQAGHIDSAQAAIANQPGVANAEKGVAPLPEFRVNEVRPTAGVCK